MKNIEKKIGMPIFRKLIFAMGIFLFILCLGGENRTIRAASVSKIQCLFWWN